MLPGARKLLVLAAPPDLPLLVLMGSFPGFAPLLLGASLPALLLVLPGPLSSEDLCRWGEIRLAGPFRGIAGGA